MSPSLARIYLHVSFVSFVDYPASSHFYPGIFKKFPLERLDFVLRDIGTEKLRAAHKKSLQAENRYRKGRRGGTLSLLFS